MRIELTTYALRVRCSTPELPGRVFRKVVYCRNPARNDRIYSSSISFNYVEHFPKTQVPGHITNWVASFANHVFPKYMSY